MLRYATKLSTIFDFARELARLSTCKRSRVGCVIFPPDCSAIYAIGYNGPVAGAAEDACANKEGGCGCVHAEANAIIKLDPSRIERAVLFTTRAPCESCAKLIVNTRVVKAVFYDEPYRDPAGLQFISGWIPTAHVPTGSIEGALKTSKFSEIVGHCETLRNLGRKHL